MKLIISRIFLILFLLISLFNCGKISCGRKTYMYCINCGNKIDDNAYICVNCGVLVNKGHRSKKNTLYKSGNTLGIISIFLGTLALVLSLSCFFIDISEVGMYTEFYDRFNYAARFVLFPFVFMFLSLICALKKKSNIFNRIGLGLALTAAFLIITEIMVIIIY